MRKILVIAAREYRASVQTKAFIISLVFMPLLVGGSIVIQTLTMGVGDKEAKEFAVIDWTPGRHIGLFLQMMAAKGVKDLALAEPRQKKVPGRGAPFAFVIKVIPHRPYADYTPREIEELRYQLSQKVEENKYFGFVEIGPKVLEDDPKVVQEALKDPQKRNQFIVRYQTDHPTYAEFPAWLQEMVNFGIPMVRAAKRGLSEDQLKAILLRVEVHQKGLSERNAAGQIVEAPARNPAVAFLMPMGLMMLMFMVIMVGATPLMQGIIEEKMQRIAEVLLGSVPPFGLMMGKLLGMVGVALTLVVVYLGGAYWAAHHFGVANYLPPELVGWFLLFQVLAVLMFGSLFIAIGAACTDMKETQTLLMPVMMVVCVPLFLMGHVIQHPNSGLSTWMSLIPPATPMMMIARQAVPPGIPWWQPALGVVLVLATTLLCVYIAGRIFRVGILMQGKGAKFSDLLRWIFRG